MNSQLFQRTSPCTRRWPRTGSRSSGHSGRHHLDSLSRFHIQLYTRQGYSLEGLELSSNSNGIPTTGALTHTCLHSCWGTPLWIRVSHLSSYPMQLLSKKQYYTRQKYLNIISLINVRTWGWVWAGWTWIVFKFQWGSNCSNAHLFALLDTFDLPAPLIVP